VLAERDWVRSFDEVVIFHDNDEPGEKAKENLITIIGLDKVTTVNFKRNDANEVLTKDGEKALMEIIWDAEVPRPAGLVGKEELWEALVTQNSIVAKEYPDCLDGLNSKLKGMRFAEIALFVSGTGCGKTTLMREIGLHILETSDDMIGICSLEETKAETARKYAAMSLKVNPQEAELSLDELRVGFDNVFGDDRVVVLDHKNSVKDASIVDKLEYMALMGCKYLFVDHITILVSEGTEGLTGNEAIDKIMNDLLRVAQQHNVWIGLVSHLRKTQRGTRNFEAGEMPTLDDIRGSGSIKQVSFDIIGFARDTTSALESENNTVHISVLKGRTVGRTGPTRGAIYDPKTGRYYADPNRPESVGRSDSFSTTATATEVVEYKPTELVKESDIKFVFIPELDDVRALTKMELEQWSETVELSKEDFLSFVNTREPSDKTIEEVKESSNHPDEF
jgi:twinkle protein